MKLDGAGAAFELDVKRFYLPGIVLRDDCPKCGAECVHDFGKWYLSYPQANEAFLEGLYCRACSHEWKVELILVVELRTVPVRCPQCCGSGQDGPSGICERCGGKGVP